MQNQGQRMQSGAELLSQQTIDQPMARHPVQSVKPRTCDGDIEMRLPTAPKSFRPGMMRVTGAVILDLERRGRQFPSKDRLDPFPSGRVRRGRA